MDDFRNKVIYLAKHDVGVRKTAWLLGVKTQSVKQILREAGYLRSYCSICGDKSNDLVKVRLAGLSYIYICNKCMNKLTNKKEENINE